MKALRILRTTLYYTSHNNINTNSSTIFRALFSAQPLTPQSQPLESESESESESDSVFDSSHYEIPTSHDNEPKPTWNEKYRGRADKLIFGEEGGPKGKLKLKEEEDERRRRALAKALLQAALDSQKEDEDDDDEESVGVVKEEDQKSLSVGIIGAPNAGKSALTNYMVSSFSSILLFMLFSFILSPNLVLLLDREMA